VGQIWMGPAGFLPMMAVGICGVEPSRSPVRGWIYDIFKSSICICRCLELPIHLSRPQLTNYLAV
jgi:hypothetical protein